MAKENKKLEEQIHVIYGRWEKEVGENRQLKAENEKLRSENRSLKERIGDLQGEIGLLYKSSKEFLKERTEDVRAFKNAFKDFIGELQEKITGSEFERFISERARERDRGMEK